MSYYIEKAILVFSYLSIHTAISVLVTFLTKERKADNCLCGDKGLVMDEAIQNRNRNKRIKTKMNVSYGPYQDVFMKGYCSDISVGGLYLETDLPLSVNESIFLLLPLPSRRDPVACEAKVAWTNPAIGARKRALPPGVGLQFLGLTRDQSAALSGFVNLAHWGTARRALA